MGIYDTDEEEELVEEQDSEQEEEDEKVDEDCGRTEESGRESDDETTANETWDRVLFELLASKTEFFIKKEKKGAREQLVAELSQRKIEKTEKQVRNMINNWISNGRTPKWMTEDKKTILEGMRETARGANSSFKSWRYLLFKEMVSRPHYFEGKCKKKERDCIAEALKKHDFHKTDFQLRTAINDLVFENKNPDGMTDPKDLKALAKIREKAAGNCRQNSRRGLPWYYYLLKELAAMPESELKNRKIASETLAVSLKQHDVNQTEEQVYAVLQRLIRKTRPPSWLTDPEDVEMFKEVVKKLLKTSVQKRKVSYHSYGDDSVEEEDHLKKEAKNRRQKRPLRFRPKMKKNEDFATDEDEIVNNEQDEFHDDSGDMALTEKDDQTKSQGGHSSRISAPKNAVPKRRRSIRLAQKRKDQAASGDDSGEEEDQLKKETKNHPQKKATAIHTQDDDEEQSEAVATDGDKVINTEQDEFADYSEMSLTDDDDHLFQMTDPPSEGDVMSEIVASVFDHIPLEGNPPLPKKRKIEVDLDAFSDTEPLPIDHAESSHIAVEQRRLEQSADDDLMKTLKKKTHEVVEEEIDEEMKDEPKEEVNKNVVPLLDLENEEGDSEGDVINADKSINEDQEDESRGEEEDPVEAASRDCSEECIAVEMPISVCHHISQGDESPLLKKRKLDQDTDALADTEPLPVHRTASSVLVVEESVLDLTKIRVQEVIEEEIDEEAEGEQKEKVKKDGAPIQELKNQEEESEGDATEEDESMDEDREDESGEEDESMEEADEDQEEEAFGDDEEDVAIESTSAVGVAPKMTPGVPDEYQRILSEFSMFAPKPGRGRPPVEKTEEEKKKAEEEFRKFMGADEEPSDDDEFLALCLPPGFQKPKETQGTSSAEVKKTAAEKVDGDKKGGNAHFSRSGDGEKRTAVLSPDEEDAPTREELLKENSTLRQKITFMSEALSENARMIDDLKKELREYKDAQKRRVMMAKYMEDETDHEEEDEIDEDEGEEEENEMEEGEDDDEDEVEEEMENERDDEEVYDFTPMGQSRIDRIDDQDIKKLVLLKGETVGEKADRYKLKEIIGAGTFGLVFGAKNIKSGKVSAVKLVADKSAFESEMAIVDELKEQASIDEYLCVPSAGFKGSYRGTDFCAFILEILQIDLHSLTFHPEHASKMFPSRSVLTILAQIFSALSFLNCIGYIYSDIKGDNVMVKSFELEEGEGQKFIIHHPVVRLIDINSVFPSSQDEQYICQPAPYRAPEVIVGAKYGEKIDSFSCGLLALELLMKARVIPRDYEDDDVNEKYMHVAMLQAALGKKIPKDLWNEGTLSKPQRLPKSPKPPFTVASVLERLEDDKGSIASTILRLHLPRLLEISPVDRPSPSDAYKLFFEALPRTPK